MADDRFKYEVYERNVLATREELTKFSKLLLSVQTSTISMILTVVKIVGLWMLFKIRQNMMSEELRIGKHIYERRRSSQNQDDSNDSQDGLSRE